MEVPCIRLYMFAHKTALVMISRWKLFFLGVFSHLEQFFSPLVAFLIFGSFSSFLVVFVILGSFYPGEFFSSLNVFSHPWKFFSSSVVFFHLFRTFTLAPIPEPKLFPNAMYSLMIILISMNTISTMIMMIIWNTVIAILMDRRVGPRGHHPPFTGSRGRVLSPIYTAVSVTALHLQVAG